MEVLTSGLSFLDHLLLKFSLILVVCLVNKSDTHILVVMWYDETIKRGLPQYHPNEFSWTFGLALVGKDIVFRFIIKYSSLRDFGPKVIIGLFLYDYFWKTIIWLVLILEISYRVIIISWRILFSFRGFFFFEDYIFAWWNIWVSIILLLPP